jgi:hypothetical protein
MGLCFKVSITDGSVLGDLLCDKACFVMLSVLFQRSQLNHLGTLIKNKLAVFRASLSLSGFS